MIMNKIRVFMAFIVTAFLVCSCDRDEQNSSSDKQGTLSVQLNASSETINGGTRSGEEGEAALNVGDFSLNIYRGETLVQSWDKFSTFQKGTMFPYGTFKAEASLGSMNDEGFDKPFVYGTNEFTINSADGTDVPIACTLQNAKITVDYTEAFKLFFESYSARVVTSLGNAIEFSSIETREAYVKPGTINVYVDVKRQTATTTSSIAIEPFEAKAKYQYNITFDVNAGAAQMTVTFTEEVSEVIQTIDLSDEALNALPPYFTPSGFVSGTAQEVVEGKSLGQLTALLNAQAGIQSCNLITTSTGLIAQGWPAKVDLANPTAADQAVLTSLGLKTRGLGANSDGIALLDFTDVIPNLEYTLDDNSSIFALAATDKYGRTTVDTLELVVNALDNGFGFALPATTTYNSTETTATLTIDGNPESISYQWFAMGVWQNITPISVTLNGTNTYDLVFNFTVPLTNVDTGLKMRANYKRRSIEAVSVISSITAAAVSDGAVRATSANFEIAINSTQTRSAYSMDNIKMEYAENNSWVEPTQSYSGNIITVTGLNAGKSYNFRTKYDDGYNEPLYFASTSIQTEESLQLPNSDMNDWNLEKSIALGEGKWNGLNPTTYYAYKPNTGNWATTNAKTFNHGENHGALRYAINAYPSVIYEERDNTNKAAVIRSIGWSNGDGNSYPGLTGNVCKEWSAGKLFLGTYSFDVDNKVDTYNYGIEFTSRPRKISFD